MSVLNNYIPALCSSASRKRKALSLLPPSHPSFSCSYRSRAGHPVPLPINQTIPPCLHSSLHPRPLPLTTVAPLPLFLIPSTLSTRPLAPKMSLPFPLPSLPISPHTPALVHLRSTLITGFTKYKQSPPEVSGLGNACELAHSDTKSNLIAGIAAHFIKRMTLGGIMRSNNYWFWIIVTICWPTLRLGGWITAAKSCNPILHRIVRSDTLWYTTPDCKYTGYTS